MPLLTDPIRIGSHESPSRVVFGPHETNLGRNRALSERHVDYYLARAAGGAGVIVTETASVHESDWPYERAPLASACGEGWESLARACGPYQTVLLAGLGHCGGQGSSAYSQSVLWAPSPVADAASREMPAEMEPDEIGLVVAGFESAAALARRSGLAGVELDAGPRSLLRQFHSGLTNHRGDRYGTDRLAFTKEALAAARRGVGPEGIVALRLSADEQAPWAGVTPEIAATQVEELAGLVDLVVVVRGGPYSSDAYRPREHAGEGFNVELTSALRRVAAPRAAVVLQGSVVEWSMAEAAIADEVADLVEMTRAQIAEPSLVSLVRAGTPERIRPCLLCNQACAVRDARNPIVSCVGEPASGYEARDVLPAPRPAASGVDALVVGGGPAGLECARALATLGHRVRLLEASGRLGGALARAATGPGRARLARLVSWLEAECRRLGVAIELGREAVPADLEEAAASGVAVVLATGSRPAPHRVLADAVEGAPAVLDALAALEAGVASLPDGPVAVDDPIGGPIGVAVAEWLAAAGRQVAVVTQDQVVGTNLARSGDLAGANARLQQAGVIRELRSAIAGAEPGVLVLEDVWTGERRHAACAVVVDCGHRLAETTLADACPGLPRAGDAVAPRSVLEAVLEGRRRAVELDAAAAADRPAPSGAAR